MNVPFFIASRLKFKERIAIISVSLSFFVIVLSVAISNGFTWEIRKAVSNFVGDIVVIPNDMSFSSEEYLNVDKAFVDTLMNIKDVKLVRPVVYRYGLVNQDNGINGVLVKGDNNSLPKGCISIPKSFANKYDKKVGDKLVLYFIGDNLQLRSWVIKNIYDDYINLDNSFVIYANLQDMQRLMLWKSNQYSAIELVINPNVSINNVYNISDSVGDLIYKNLEDLSNTYIIAVSTYAKYSNIFSWLELVNTNVYFILILMIIVSGFNMISGLLIILFRNISTIGILKTFGMTNFNIAKVFLRLGSNIIIKGMLIGNGLALLFCGLQYYFHIIKLDPKNYFIDFVPVHLNLTAWFLANLCTYVAIMILLLIPSTFISKVDPAKTIKAS